MADKIRYNALTGKWDLVNDLSLYATKEYVDSQISGENHWDYAAGVLTPHIANSSVNIGTGTFTGVNVTSGIDPGHTHSVYLTPEDMWLVPPIIEWWDPDGGLPPDPEIGDRYGSDGTAYGWTIDYIYEWDGEEWIESEPEEGWMIWALFELIMWVFFSGGWMEMGEYSYLKLDQTTPQTIINGIPLLENNRIIDQNRQLVDKEYVDLAVASLTITEFFTSVVLDAGPPVTYEMCGDLPSPDTIASAVFDYDPNPIPIFNFLTCVGNPSIDKILAGSYISHIHIYKDSKDIVQVYYELWRTDSAGVDIEKLGTSALSGDLPEAPAGIRNIEVVLANDFDLDLTDRIKVKWFMVLEDGAKDTSVFIEVGTNQDSKFTISSTASELINIFVPYTGAKQDVDLGVHNLTVDTDTLFVDSINHRVGIGTTTPASLLSVIGGLTTVGSVLTLGTKELTVVANDILGRINFYAPLESDSGDSRLVGASIAAIAEGTFSATVNTTSLAFQTGASEIATTKMTIMSNGNIGIGTTTPDTLLQLKNNSWFSAKDFAGTSYVNMFKVSESDEIDVGGLLNISGGLEAPADSGAIVLFDMPVVSALVGVEQSATIRLDNNNIFKFYCESNGAGGIQNTRNYSYGTFYPRTGNSAAGTTPIIMTAGALNTTPVAGAIEFDGTDFYLII